MGRRIVLWLVIVLVSAVCTQEENNEVNKLEETGAAYLQNVMDKLQQEREEGQSVEIMELANILNMDRVSEPAPDHTNAPTHFQPSGINGPTPNPPLLQAQVQSLTPPPPVLTSEELTAIYKAALAKGATLPQLQNSPSVADPQKAVQPETQGVAGDAYPGYYYYFYPIKSFLNNMEALQAMKQHPQGLELPPLQQTMNAMDPNSTKGMEPLFMAVTGFIGMALMFIVSVLFIPRLGNIRAGSIPELKEAPNDLAVLGKLVIESMDGKDCTERMACEIGRFVRTLKMEKMFKVMEIILPPNMARQVTLIRKAAVKKEKCNFIPCRFKTSRPPAKTDLTPKPWKKGPSPHELWMKHFEKQKKPGKKQTQNVWDKKT